MKDNKCKCEFCTTNRLYNWSVVINCKCVCHEDGFTSHSGMCCALPNVLKADNPNLKLESPDFYLAILNRIQDEDDEAMKNFNNDRI